MDVEIATNRTGGSKEPSCVQLVRCGNTRFAGLPDMRGLPIGRSSVMQAGMSMTGNKMTEKYSITEARRNLPRLIRKAEHGETVELTRRGETVAVLVGQRTFERLTAGRRSFAEAYREFKTTVDLAELDLDPDELFAGARDPSPGRQVRL